MATTGSINALRTILHINIWMMRFALLKIYEYEKTDFILYADDSNGCKRTDEKCRAGSS